MSQSRRRTLGEQLSVAQMQIRRLTKERDQARAERDEARAITSCSLCQSRFDVPAADTATEEET